MKCPCGKNIKTKAGMYSHARACVEVHLDARGVWEVIRKGVFRFLYAW